MLSLVSLLFTKLCSWSLCYLIAILSLGLFKLFAQTWADFVFDIAEWITLQRGCLTFSRESKVAALLVQVLLAYKANHFKVGVLLKPCCPDKVFWQIALQDVPPQCYFQALLVQLLLQHFVGKTVNGLFWGFAYVLRVNVFCLILNQNIVFGPWRNTVFVWRRRVALEWLRMMLLLKI